METSFAQNTNLSKREQRKLDRIEGENAQIANVKRMLENQSFTFHASRLTSTGIAAISNIRLNALWYVTVSPKRLQCYLPVYGTATPISQPSVTSRMDIKTNNFTYEVTPPGDRQKNYQVKIVTKDTRSNSIYTLLFLIPEDGRNVSVNISSTFNAPVVFDGYILNK